MELLAFRAFQLRNGVIGYNLFQLQFAYDKRQCIIIAWMVNAWLYGNQCSEMSSDLISGIYMYFGIIIDTQLKIGRRAKIYFSYFSTKNI